MSVGETEEILSANAAFYAAMRAGDLGRMDRLWSPRWRVSCTHPGREMLIGRTEVMASWRMILAPGRAVPIICRRPSAVRTGTTAMVICEEMIGGVRLMAVNSFALEAGPDGTPGWRMIGHHAAETT